MKDYTDGKLEETLLFAKSINDDSLDNCIKSLKNTENNVSCEIEVFNDFAEKSFYFVRKRCGNFIGNGGIIWHGSKENPLSVTLTPSTDWRIHT